VLVDLDGVRLLTDPTLRRRIFQLRRAAAVEPPGALDAVLVSHAHYDHLDLPSLERLPRSVRIVVPRGAGRLVRGFGAVSEVDAGDVVDVGPVRVRAVHAEHDGRRGLLGVLAAALGYVFEGSRSVYFAGDTDLFAGMAELGPLDVAALPIAGWGPRLPAGHLDPERAAEALRLLRPRTAVPIHWGTFAPPLARPGADLPELFRRRAAELAPEVEIRVLAVGESFGLE
jgi:L-ascorbate metabolism protein UlaG (beta-lactamase superfamily)